jgi:hypothetical protein
VWVDGHGAARYSCWRQSPGVRACALLCCTHGLTEQQKLTTVTKEVEEEAHGRCGGRSGGRWEASRLGPVAKVGWGRQGGDDME